MIWLVAACKGSALQFSSPMPCVVKSFMDVGTGATGIGAPALGGRRTLLFRGVGWHLRKIVFWMKRVPGKVPDEISTDSRALLQSLHWNLNVVRIVFVGFASEILSPVLGNAGSRKHQMGNIGINFHSGKTHEYEDDYDLPSQGGLAGHEHRDPVSNHSNAERPLAFHSRSETITAGEHSEHVTVPCSLVHSV